MATIRKERRATREPGRLERPKRLYESFYGFREKPFSALPDPAFLYLGPQHDRAYTLLEYGVMNRAGFTVLTGEIGCGKTILIRRLLNELNDEVTVGLLSNTHKRIDNLLEWVLMAFGLDHESKSPVRKYDKFVEFLIGEYARNRRVLLIVDEAQNLDESTLEELRTLSNINADKDLVFQLILAGQPELRATLSRPDLRQLTQRVVTHYHLEPLSKEETTRYIRHRLSHAGGPTDLFSPEACWLVHRQTGGVPRLINLLCDTALVYGYAESVSAIGTNLVRCVIDEGAAGMSSLKPGCQQEVQPQQLPPGAAYGSTYRTSQGNGEKYDRVVQFDRSEVRQLFSHLLKEDPPPESN